MRDKREANKKRAMQFALQVKLHSGLSWAKLEHKLGIGQDCIDPRKSGETLSRWSKGRSMRVQMRDVQRRARVALDNRLLPPLRDGLLHRPDTFGASDITRNADEVWEAENKRLQAVGALHANTIEQIAELAKQLAGDATMIALDADGAEVHPSDLLALAEKLRSITLHKIDQ